LYRWRNWRGVCFLGDGCLGGDGSLIGDCSFFDEEDDLLLDDNIVSSKLKRSIILLSL
jgi:hypothetical protein